MASGRVRAVRGLRGGTGGGWDVRLVSTPMVAGKAARSFT